jgi:hypothetical protein
MPVYLSWYLRFRVSGWSPSVNIPYLPLPSHYPSLDHPNDISEEYKLWSTFLHPPLTSLLLCPNTLLRVFLPQTALWSSGESSWLQIQRSEFDSRRYQIFWEIVGLERGPLSLVRIIEELYQGNSGSGRRRADHVTPSIRKIDTNFADKRRSLGRYSSLADYRPRSFCISPTRSQSLSSTLFRYQSVLHRKENFEIVPYSGY